MTAVKNLVPSLRNVIRAARERAGLDVGEIAKRIGYHRDSVRLLEAGTYSPGRLLLERLRDLLQFSPMERVILDAAIERSFRGNPPTKRILPDRDAYRLSEVCWRLSIDGEKLRSLIDAKEFVVLDLRKTGARRPLWRITRESYERFLKRKVVK